MPEITLPSRSVGLKFLLVCVLAAFMALPAFMIFGMVYERTNRGAEVVSEVSKRYGGEQTFTGPVLAAPYKRTVTPEPSESDPNPKPRVTTGWYIVFAKTGSAAADAKVSESSRGAGDLFKVRVFDATLDFNAAFDLAQEPRAAPEGALIDWSKAVVLVGVTDPRGAVSTGALEVAGRSIPFEPGAAYEGAFNIASDGANRPVPAATGMRLLAAPAGDLARPGVAFDAHARLEFKGVEALSLVAFADDTALEVKSNWKDLGFYGSLPSPEGYDPQAAHPKATWKVPYIARNLPRSGDAPNVAGYQDLNVQVRFVDQKSPYQAVTRTLKYALMFVGVVFLAYFLMEATSDRRVHPAQYVLVGLAQAIFYLLLLSLGERVGFDVAFLAAASATVTLIGAYAGAIFQSLAKGAAAFAAFATLYGLIYLLMRLEDYALLAGSCAAFLAVAGVMFFTRRLDWYGLTRLKA